MTTDQLIAAQLSSPTLLGEWLRAIEATPLTERGLDRLAADMEEDEDAERWDGQG